MNAAEAFTNCAPPSRAVIDLLAQRGANIGEYPLAQVVGLARIRVAGRLFTFDENGTASLITPVRAFRPHEIEDCRPTESALFGSIVDLVAWDPRAPAGRFAVYRDAASWLGCVEPQYLDPDPVPIWRGPLNWLRAGCRGIVILAANDQEKQTILHRLAKVDAEDETHRCELKRIACTPLRAPEITRRAA